MKLIVATAFVLSLVVCLTACGKVSSTENVSTTTATTTVSAETTLDRDTTADVAEKNTQGTSANPSGFSKTSAGKTTTTTKRGYSKAVFELTEPLNKEWVYPQPNAQMWVWVMQDNSDELQGIAIVNSHDHFRLETDIYAIGKGLLTHRVNYGYDSPLITEEAYQVNYKGTTGYVTTDVATLQGTVITADDGSSRPVGEVLYHGKYHDITVNSAGNYICDDGCSSDAFAAGPRLKSFADFCAYADADHTDPETGIIYPVCCTTPQYKGTYGNVYVLPDSAGNSSHTGGFVVVPHEQLIDFEKIPEEYQRNFDLSNLPAGTEFLWNYTGNISTLSAAKEQANATEPIHGIPKYSGRHLIGF